MLFRFTYNSNCKHVLIYSPQTLPLVVEGMFINQLGVQVSKVPTLPLDDEGADLTRRHCKLPDETD